MRPAPERPGRARTGPALLAGVAAFVVVAAGGGAWWAWQRSAASDAPAAVAPVAVPEASSPPADPVASSDPLPFPPAAAPRVAEGAEYDACLARLRDDAEGALAFAEAWEARLGGAAGATADGARHCGALALIALGEPERAAPRLESLAARSPAPAPARAVVYGQAGQAWVAAGQPARALGAITLALALAPEDPDLLVDRAMASGALGRHVDALADATRAAALEPNRPDAWVVRAAALRQLGRPQEAMRDVEHALSLEPDDPEALLERGILRQAGGDAEGARADWRRAADVAPESAAADLAEQNLALSEAGPSRLPPAAAPPPARR